MEYEEFTKILMSRGSEKVMFYWNAKESWDASLGRVLMLG